MKAKPEKPAWPATKGRFWNNNVCGLTDGGWQVSLEAWRSLFRGTDDLLRQEASIHDKGGAGGKFRVVGTEIENCGGDLLAGAYPPDRDNRGNVVAHPGFVAGKAIEHFGRNRARGDGVDADVLFGELE